MMTGRILEICSHIPRSELFADVGCDHGYCARYVLDNGLAEKVYITDVSPKSLEKAKTLLKKEIASGRCVPLVGDGLDPLPEPCTVLVAGMGGEEIVKIFSRKIPPRFLLQPMKNSEKLRRFLVERGCRITLDYTFFDRKYYDLIGGEKSGGGGYSERELRYGRDNLRTPNAAFLKKLEEEIKKTRGYLNDAKSPAERERLEALLREEEEILHDVENNL